MSNDAYPAFCWDCNCCWGTVEDDSDLRVLFGWLRHGLVGHGELASFSEAARHLRDGTCLGPAFVDDERHPRNSDETGRPPKFGHRSECIGGETTLGEWLKSRGWELAPGIWREPVLRRISS